MMNLCEEDVRVVPLSLASLNLSVTVNKVGEEKRALLSRHAQRTKRKRDYEVAGDSCYKIFGHNFIYADFAKLSESGSNFCEHWMSRE